MTIAVAIDDWEMVKHCVLQNGAEGCVVGICSTANGSAGTRTLVSSWLLPEERDYRDRSAASAELSPEYVARAANIAKAAAGALLFLHSHPFDRNRPDFSTIDDKGEQRLAAFLKSRNLPGPHFSIVVSKGGVRARELGTTRNVDVVIIGAKFEVHSDRRATYGDEHDRQIRAFGHGGQRAISSTSVAIVGLGGMGSAIAQQLALLGVRRMGLFDPDFVERTNLNRLFLADHGTIGQKKVSAISRKLGDSFPGMQVEENADDICVQDVAKRLIGWDFIFGCTDTHGSRAVINQIAYQYLIPTIDTGTVINSHGGKVTAVLGRVQALLPGNPCLVCSEVLDYDAVRRDLMSPEERIADPYFTGQGVPEPAVAPINSVVASLAVVMYMSIITGVPTKSRFQLYDAVPGRVRPINAKKDPRCVVCSARYGVLNQGGRIEILGRKM